MLSATINRYATATVSPGGKDFTVRRCDPLRRYAAQEVLHNAESQLVNLTFVEPGVRTWTVK